MYLLTENGRDITRTSRYRCDGDDCDISDYCDGSYVEASLRETFKMLNLTKGTYFLKLPLIVAEENDIISLSVHCESDDDWDTIDSDIDGAPSMSVVVGMAMAVTAMLIEVE